VTAIVPRPNDAADADLALLSEQIEDRSDDAARAMSELASVLVADESVETTLRRVAELARAAIPGCDAAGVTIRDGDRYVTVAWTDGQTLAVDKEQYVRDQGPCLEALTTQRIVRTGIVAAQERWPEFAAAAGEGGVQSFLAAPLILSGEGLGSLNLYSHSADGFDRLDDALVAMFAAQATVALANVRVHQQVVTLASQLERALQSRAPIEQAKGILMARHGYSDAEAFASLRRLSQQRNVKLREVALEVVADAQRAAATTLLLDRAESSSH
jgi:GAF domain-containing protein